MLAAAPSTPQEDNAFVRLPAVAGRFYAAVPRELADEVQALLIGAGPQRLHRIRALVVPHAGYACSGEVAAAAYRALAGSFPPPGAAGAAAPSPATPGSATPGPAVRHTVYLLGPAHWKSVHGVGLSSAGAFATPLGPIPVAVDTVRHLAALGGQYHIDDPAHAPEHCLEVQLPFLQTVLRGLQIVPMLFDDMADPAAVAHDLHPLLQDSDDVLLVSTDLSHYHPYQDAIISDHSLLKALATGDIAAANTGEACGLLPLLTLMHLAHQLGWKPHLLAYANSGDTCGSRREVVGYGALAYTA